MSNHAPKISKTIAQADMRAINTSAVLEYLRLSGPASRTEIAQRLNISKPTAMRIVDELRDKGFVASTGIMEEGRGRSRELLGLNTRGNQILSIDIGGSHIGGVIANIGGEILQEFHESRQWASPEENFNVLRQWIEKFLKIPKEKPTNLLGIALGVPGITDSHQGVVVHAPSLSWEDFPLIKKLTPHFNLPICIENDVNLAVLGEHWFGAGIGTDDLIMIAIGTGIGSGIILDGKLHRGHNQSSGEIGYLIPGVQYLDNQYPGFGALETLASGVGIAERALGKLRDSGSENYIDGIDAEFVFQAARDGKVWAVETIQETVDLLSLAVANITVCFDPALIILGGGVSNADDLLINPIKERLKGVIPVIPRIEKSRLGVNAVMLGGVVQVFHKVTGYAVLHQG
jgi:predicted NBD/HSP70 family sugar kinase